ncbi:MAG: hypothetical protein ACREQ5_06735 [Candidatus Dormibacteria bacterium]
MSYTGNVLVLKLVTGEEVIGRLASSNIEPDKVVLENILAVGYEIKAPGQFGFGFMPYSPLTEDVKTFSNNMVVYQTKPKEQLLQAYNKTTGAIVVPKQDILLS